MHLVEVSIWALVKQVSFIVQLYVSLFSLGLMMMPDSIAASLDR